MNELVRMLEIQYNDSFDMLKNVVRICPDSLWAGGGDLPVWNQMIHSLMGSDFWLRSDYSSEFVSCLPIPENVREQLWSEEWCSAEDGFMTKEQVMECFNAFEKKKAKFFASLTDDMLSRKILPDMEFTYLSVICAQIRHIMCHAGMCASAITAAGGEELPWIAFGEG